MKRKRTKTSESVIECKTNKIASEVIELSDEDIILVDDQQKPSTSTTAEHISPLTQRLDAIFNKIKFVIIQVLRIIFSFIFLGLRGRMDVVRPTPQS